MEVKLVSDVWGIGCLLHELVTGFPVWHEHRHALDKEFASLVSFIVRLHGHWLFLAVCFLEKKMKGLRRNMK